MCWRSIFLVARHQKCLKLSFYRAVWRNSADGWSEKKIRKLKPSLFQRWLPSLNKNKCEKRFIKKQNEWFVLTESCWSWLTSGCLDRAVPCLLMSLIPLTRLDLFITNTFCVASAGTENVTALATRHKLFLYNTCRRVLLGFFLDGCSVNIHCDILIFNDVFISVILGTGISAVTPCFEAHTWDFILDAKYFSRCC